MRLSYAHERAIRLLIAVGAYDGAKVAGQRRIALPTWDLLRRRGLVQYGFPYRLTERGVEVAQSLTRKEAPHR